MEGDFAPKLRPNLSHHSQDEGLATAVRRFILQLRSEFGAEIERDPRGFRIRVIRLLTTALPLKNGRPRLENVTRAHEKWRQGKNWREIYTVCIPPGLSGDSLVLAQSRLRSAVRARRRSPASKLSERGS